MSAPSTRFRVNGYPRKRTQAVKERVGEGGGRGRHDFLTGTSRFFVDALHDNRYDFRTFFESEHRGSGKALVYLAALARISLGGHILLHPKRAAVPRAYN